MCNTLEINIELISIRNDGKKVMLNTTPKVHTLVKGHYFINGATTLPSFCLEKYEEVTDMKSCNGVYRKAH